MTQVDNGSEVTNWLVFLPGAGPERPLNGKGKAAAGGQEERPWEGGRGTRRGLERRLRIPVQTGAGVRAALGSPCHSG